MTSLAHPGELARRRGLLAAARMAPLRPLVEEFRARFGETPDPDPRDGGAEARLLILLETPGPRIRATGIVSRDNPSGTSRNLAALLDGAGIGRRDTLIWNAVPWIIHDPGAPNRAPRRSEVRQGVACLPGLLALLPRLAVAILSGRVAGEAEAVIRTARPDLPVLRMPHPSPTIQCTSPLMPARCRSALGEAAAILARIRDPGATGRPLDLPRPEPAR